MASSSWQRAVSVGALFLASAGWTHASPQVVGDEACERYQVDMASFAHCEGGKVVRPAPDPVASIADSAGVSARSFALQRKHRMALQLAGLATAGNVAMVNPDVATARDECRMAPEPMYSVVYLQAQ